MEKQFVHCVLVTGEIATAFYEGTQSPTTGSYLATDVKTEDGQYADYAWANKIV